MTRKIRLACLLGVFPILLCFSQTTSPAPQQQNNGSSSQQPAVTPPSEGQPVDEDQPPEEDQSVRPRIYPFDPMQAERSMRIGTFYMRQGTSRGYRAAAGRFEDATKYNPGSAEAFLKLGEAQEKLKNKDKAKLAFERVVQLAPDSKLAREAKKKMANL